MSKVTQLWIQTSDFKSTPPCMDPHMISLYSWRNRRNKGKGLGENLGQAGLGSSLEVSEKYLGHSGLDLEDTHDLAGRVHRVGEAAE